MNLPNLISLARLIAVPIAIWLILNGFLGYAFWLFLIAGASDAIDGYLARRLNARTEVGTYLDPLADKALLVCVFVTLGYVGKIETWLVILVVSRDVMIVGGVILAFVLGDPYEAKPSFLSKINTTVQIAFCAFVLAMHGLNWPIFQIPRLEAALAYTVAVTTVVSGAGYLINWARHAALSDGVD